MKKNIVLTLLSICFLTSVHAQFRKLRKDEIDYLNKAHLAIWNAIPHEYKDWTPNGDEKAFEAAQHWAGGDEKYFGTCPVSVGKSEPYNINVFQDFAMSSSESGTIAMESMKKITDYQNGAQIAAALKYSAKTKIQVHVYSNVDGGAFVIRSCDKVSLVKIELPVKATLAYKAIRSESCPMYESGTKTVDMHGDYYDNALIFLGQPVAKKENDDRHDGITRTVYNVGLDKTKLSKPLMQNIIVQITGNSDDIDAVIKAIDWKALNDMIGK